MGKVKKRRSEKGIFFKLFFIMMFIFGALVLLYPFISDLWNQMRTETIVEEYVKEIDKLPSEKLEEEYQKAESYNGRHKSNIILDVFSLKGPVEKEYESLLNIRDDGIMGYLEIPKIKQRIVIYHGTKEEVLKKGAGHMAGTSLPIGGESSHAVIAAHRGLPSAKLFTDIDQLEEGDEFYLFILDKTIAYEVDQIKVVEPDCLEELQIIEGKDYLTLFTCTPYSVNTHRLLVRGHRIPYAPDSIGAKEGVDTIKNHRLLILFILVFLTMIIVIFARKRNR